jgi:hypothetical protein
MTDMRMILCAQCGNKRCPHAADHRLACTNSNEPGQPGSNYPRVPAAADLPRFPTVLRKMWSGGEVQAWLDEHVAPVVGENAYVEKRLAESLAEVYATILGDDARDQDDSLNAIERVKKAAQVLRLEVDLYRENADASVQSVKPVAEVQGSDLVIGRESRALRWLPGIDPYATKPGTKLYTGPQSTQEKD